MALDLVERSISTRKPEVNVSLKIIVKATKTKNRILGRMGWKDSLGKVSWKHYHLS